MKGTKMIPEYATAAPSDVEEVFTRVRCGMVWSSARNMLFSIVSWLA